MKQFALLLIRFYQKILSPLSAGSCRYYPSCSEYAKWQFEYNHPLKALILTLWRITRCNPFFSGGIDYPVTCHKLQVDSYGKSKPIQVWFVPIDGHCYRVIKTFKTK